jgi:hypothetical protein
MRLEQESCASPLTRGGPATPRNESRQEGDEGRRKSTERADFYLPSNGAICWLELRSFLAVACPFNVPIVSVHAHS